MHRSRLNQRCTGYASVLPPDHQPATDDEASWSQLRADTDRFARYTLGVPGSTFAAVAAARGWLHEQARWPADGYQFTASLALESGALLGLGIDEVNQHELTEGRIAAWVAQLSTEWQLQPSAAVAED